MQRLSTLEFLTQIGGGMDQHYGYLDGLGFGSTAALVHITESDLDALPCGQKRLLLHEIRTRLGTPTDQKAGLRPMQLFKQCKPEPVDTLNYSAGGACLSGNDADEKFPLWEDPREVKIREYKEIIASKSKEMFELQQRVDGATKVKSEGPQTAVCSNCHEPNHRVRNCPNDPCTSSLNCLRNDKHKAERGVIDQKKVQIKKLVKEIASVQAQVDKLEAALARNNQDFSRFVKAALVNSNRSNYLMQGRKNEIVPLTSRIQEDIEILKNYYSGKLPADLGTQAKYFQAIIRNHRLNKPSGGTVEEMLEHKLGEFKSRQLTNNHLVSTPRPLSNDTVTAGYRTPRPVHPVYRNHSEILRESSETIPARPCSRQVNSGSSSLLPNSVSLSHTTIWQGLDSYPNQPTPYNSHPNQPTPNNSYPQPTPPNSYPQPTSPNSYPQPTSHNSYHNVATPHNSYSQHTPPNSYPQPTPTNSYPQPTPPNSYLNSSTPHSSYGNPPTPVYDNVDYSGYTDRGTPAFDRQSASMDHPTPAAHRTRQANFDDALRNGEQGITEGHHANYWPYNRAGHWGERPTASYSNLAPQSRHSNVQLDHGLAYQTSDHGNDGIKGACSESWVASSNSNVKRDFPAPPPRLSARGKDTEFDENGQPRSPMNLIVHGREGFVKSYCNSTPSGRYRSRYVNNSPLQKSGGNIGNNDSSSRVERASTSAMGAQPATCDNNRSPPSKITRTVDAEQVDRASPSLQSKRECGIRSIQSMPGPGTIHDLTGAMSRMPSPGKCSGNSQSLMSASNGFPFPANMNSMGILVAAAARIGAEWYHAQQLPREQDVPSNRHQSRSTLNLPATKEGENATPPGTPLSDPEHQTNNQVSMQSEHNNSPERSMQQTPPANNQPSSSNCNSGATKSNTTVPAFLNVAANRQSPPRVSTAEVKPLVSHPVNSNVQSCSSSTTLASNANEKRKTIMTMGTKPEEHELHENRNSQEL